MIAFVAALGLLAVFGVIVVFRDAKYPLRWRSPLREMFDKETSR